MEEMTPRRRSTDVDFFAFVNPGPRRRGSGARQTMPTDKDSGPFQPSNYEFMFRTPPNFHLPSQSFTQRNSPKHLPPTTTEVTPPWDCLTASAPAPTPLFTSQGLGEVSYPPSAHQTQAWVDSWPSQNNTIGGNYSDFGLGYAHAHAQAYYPPQSAPPQFNLQQSLERFNSAFPLHQANKPRSAAAKTCGAVSGGQATSVDRWLDVSSWTGFEEVSKADLDVPTTGATLQAGFLSLETPPDVPGSDGNPVSVSPLTVASHADSRQPVSPWALTPSPVRAGSAALTDITQPNASDVSAPSAVTKALEIIPYDPSRTPSSKSGRKRPVFDEEPARETVLRGSNGELQGVMTVLGRPPNVKTPYDQEKMREVKRARKMGVCQHCRRLKRKCDLYQKEGMYESCTGCLSKSYKGISRSPCFRSTLFEIRLFRDGPAPNEPLFTARNDVLALIDLSKPDAPVRTIKLTQHLGHELTVYVSEFEPQDGDKLSYKWSDEGEPREMKMPNFCITNTGRVSSHLLHYIQTAKAAYLRNLLKDRDPLVWMTISMATDYSRTRPKSLVGMALDIWALGRMIEIPWEMCGDDTLGVKRISDPNNPWHGKIPIPPNMDTQLDQILIQNFLVPLRQDLTKKLEEKLHGPKREAWFEMYLATFTLLCHIEMLAKHSINHARLHRMPSRFSNVTFLEETFHTAKILLSRFHFMCNGSAPFRLDWQSADVVAMAKLEPAQVEFLQRTRAAIKSRQEDLVALRGSHRYESSLYWCQDLFSEEWDSSPPRVVESVDD